MRHFADGIAFFGLAMIIFIFTSIAAIATYALFFGVIAKKCSGDEHRPCPLSGIDAVHPGANFIAYPKAALYAIAAIFGIAVAIVLTIIFLLKLDFPTVQYVPFAVFILSEDVSALGMNILFGAMFGVVFANWCSYLVTPDRLTDADVRRLHNRWAMVLGGLLVVGLFQHDFRRLLTRFELFEAGGVKIALASRSDGGGGARRALPSKHRQARFRRWAPRRAWLNLRMRFGGVIATATSWAACRI
jgi:hypothetical protein